MWETEPTSGAECVARIREKINRYTLQDNADTRFWAQHMSVTLAEHRSGEGAMCTGCTEPWPCERVRGDAAGWE